MIFCETIREFWNLFLNDRGEYNLLGKTVKSLLILLVTLLLIRLVKKLFHRAMESKKTLGDRRKFRTVTSVVGNTVKYSFSFLALIQILDTFGVRTGSIIATAGIGGIAIGFGAQSIVKDFISGLMILMEDQYSVRDDVIIDGLSGTVVDFGMRVTRILGYDGALHIIQNGNITKVTNLSRNPQRSLVELYLPYGQIPEEIRTKIEPILEGIRKREKALVEGPSIFGITALGGRGYKLSLVAKCRAGEQWRVERLLRQKLLEELEGPLGFVEVKDEI